MSRTPGEPMAGGARPTTMRLLAVVLLCAGVLSACGSDAREASDGRAAATASPTAASQTKASDCFLETSGSITELGQVDLDGDGTPDPVRLLAANRTCPATLVSQMDGREVSVALEDDVPVTKVFGVRLASPLLATRQDQPRGGFQVRLYALDGDRLVELTQDGDPLVPFVATDVPQQDPLSVDCSGGKLVVTRGVTHEPAGVLPAWDVQQTSYTIEGAEVTGADTKEIADNVLPKQLPKDYPALVRNTLFASCG